MPRSCDSKTLKRCSPRRPNRCAAGSSCSPAHGNATAMGQDMPLQSKFNLMLGTLMRGSYHGRFYAQAQTLRAGLRRAYDELLSTFDVLVMPTTPTKAQKHNPDQT